MDIGRPRSLARQGYTEEALDDLIAWARQEGVDALQLDLDDRGRITIIASYDPTLIEAIRRIGGARRDKEAGVWRVPAHKLPGLIDLVERLAHPPCSGAGCTMDDGPAPSQAHREAHGTWCLT